MDRLDAMRVFARIVEQRSFTLAASGLGLLLTTTLLGLRRYLRQRKLQMPGAMTGLWLGIGGALIAGFLPLGADLRMDKCRRQQKMR